VVRNSEVIYKRSAWKEDWELRSIYSPARHRVLSVIIYGNFLSPTFFFHVLDHVQRREVERELSFEKILNRAEPKTTVIWLHSLD
jgi:hypothetical protein